MQKKKNQILRLVGARKKSVLIEGINRCKKLMDESKLRWTMDWCKMNLQQRRAWIGRWTEASIVFFSTVSTIGTARIGCGAVRFNVRELFVGGCNFW
jgi:hypothetical protein